MKHFQTIEKKWKSTEVKRCGQCGKTLTDDLDLFELHAKWKIKKKKDTHYYCSTACLAKWCSDDEDY